MPPTRAQHSGPSMYQSLGSTVSRGHWSIKHTTITCNLQWCSVSISSGEIATGALYFGSGIVRLGRQDPGVEGVISCQGYFL